jgi:uncharacterized protein (TIGR02996 family)
MTTEDAFVQAIREDPGDAIRWQMYADWLEERGDPRAVFYREWRSTNSFGMTFVTVPRGTFWMGGGGGKCGDREVTVEEFQIGIHPVTQGQWQAVMGNNPSWCSRDGEGKDVVKEIPDTELAQFPVESISWNDTQRFIKKLNKREQPRGWLYRLPTEAEWEYACRGGATSKEECSFHFYLAEPSNDLFPSQANFNGNYPDTKDPYLEGTTKVGSYPPNPLGIYDIWTVTVFLEGVC